MDTLSQTGPITQGKRYGALTALSQVWLTTANGPRRSMWKCVCDCGALSTVASANLKNGHTKSCGCLKIAATIRAKTTHGATKGRARLPEYKVWTDIKSRCLNPRRHSYACYGGRGITICDEWRSDFAAFFAHMGPRPSAHHQIDRIDNDRGYEPGNCRWVTKAANVRNRRGSVRLSDDQVRAIRADVRPQGAVASDYGIQRHYVSMIKTGKVYADVG
jgi:hypothetical protein